jgi:hypothetical protein
MIHKSMTLCLLLVTAGQAQAHLSHSAAPIHSVEHLLLLGALLISALLLAKPVKRIFVKARKQQRD